MRRLISIFCLCLCFGCEIPLLSNEKLSQTSREALLSGQIILSGAFRMNVKWLEGPYGNPNLESIFEVEFRDRDNLLVDLPNNLSIVHYGWMPTMGHGSADDGVLNFVGVGRYQSKFFAFNMPGHWQMIFEFFEGAQLIETVVFDYTF